MMNDFLDANALTHSPDIEGGNILDRLVVHYDTELTLLPDPALYELLAWLALATSFSITPLEMVQSSSFSVTHLLQHPAALNIINDVKRRDTGRWLFYTISQYV